MPAIIEVSVPRSLGLHICTLLGHASEAVSTYSWNR